MIDDKNDGQASSRPAPGSSHSHVLGGDDAPMNFIAERTLRVHLVDDVIFRKATGYRTVSSLSTSYHPEGTLAATGVQ